MDNARLKYAALELRMAIEALTYDHATAYKDDISPEQLETWQPRRVMQYLLVIDPMADKEATFRFSKTEDKAGEPSEMHTLGTLRVFNMESIKKHYDALGSFLHVPTLKNWEKGVDVEKLRERCNTIVHLLEKVLASKLFSLTMDNKVKTECLRCQKIMVRRMPPEPQKLETKCFECGAGYVIEHNGPKAAIIKPKRQLRPCDIEGCTGKAELWDDQIQVGESWNCDECDERFEIKFYVAHITLQRQTSQQTGNAPFEK